MRPITAWQDIEVIIKGKYSLITPEKNELDYSIFLHYSVEMLLSIINLGTWQYKFE